MGAVAIETGRLGLAEQAKIITGMDFGYAYGGFRSVDRFLDQIADDQVGFITWPGGTLAEKATERYGFQFDGLFNPALKRPGLAEMFAIAEERGVGLSVVLPTARYEGDDAALRADLRAFMGKVLSGHYGPLPDHLQFEVGNEWYFAFGGTVADARAYGHVADIYLDEMTAALNDPSVNLLGADIKIAVQMGRNVAEDTALRSEIEDSHLAEVDMVIHHRFAFTAEGVGRTVDEVGRMADLWGDEAQAAGGARPELFLGSYNVGSLTRDEALAAYIKHQAGLGIPVKAADIDMAGRTDDGFETFWQGELAKRDYGPEHPRLLLEMFAEYGGKGMAAASTYGSDMQHAGRLSLTDAQGHAQDFVGQDMLDMLAESTKGTKLLKVGLQNQRGDDVWVYGFENKDKLVVFLSADDVPPGKMTLSVKGLGTTYKAVYGDSLRAEVPADWMARFGVPDNPHVDETNEGLTYAIGIRSGVDPTVGAKGVTVEMTHPHEMVRLSFAKTEAGLREIEAFSDSHGVELAGPETVDHGPAEDAMADHDLPHLPPDAHEAHHPADETDAPGEDGGFGGGGMLLALFPLLFFL